MAVRTPAMELAYMHLQRLHKASPSRSGLLTSMVGINACFNAHENVLGPLQSFPNFSHHPSGPFVSNFVIMSTNRDSIFTLTKRRWLGF